MSRTDDSQSNTGDNDIVISVKLLLVHLIVHELYRDVKLDSFETVEIQKQSIVLDCDGRGDMDTEITGTVDDTDDVPPDNRVMVLVYKDGRG